MTDAQVAKIISSLGHIENLLSMMLARMPQRPTQYAPLLPTPAPSPASWPLPVPPMVVTGHAYAFGVVPPGGD